MGDLVAYSQEDIELWGTVVGDASRLTKLLSCEAVKQVLGHFPLYQKIPQLHGAKQGCQFCLPYSDVLKFYEMVGFS